MSLVGASLSNVFITANGNKLATTLSTSSSTGASTMTLDYTVSTGTAITIDLYGTPPAAERSLHGAKQGSLASRAMSLMSMFPVYGPLMSAVALTTTPPPVPVQPPTVVTITPTLQWMHRPRYLYLLEAGFNSATTVQIVQNGSVLFHVPFNKLAQYDQWHQFQLALTSPFQATVVPGTYQIIAINQYGKSQPGQSDA